MRAHLILISGLSAVVAATPAAAEDVCAVQPAKLRYDDSIDCFHRSESREQLPGTIKFMPLSDDAIFDYPWLYCVEPGWWDLSDEEVSRIREYLLRGGFLMLDDFHGTQEWSSFQRGMTFDSELLSPGVNDTTTAVMCVDYLAAILVRLAARRIAPPHRLDHGELRVIARGPSFASLLAEAFDQIRQNAAGNVAVLTRLLYALEIIAGQTSNLRRRQALRQQAELIVALAERTIPSPHDRGDAEASMLRLSQVLATE